MESLLIPIVALGGLALTMNDSKDSEKKNEKEETEVVENYTNMNRNINNLRATVSSYPVNTTKVMDIPCDYPNPNTATEKYFDQNNYFQKNVRGQNIHEVYSLTGNYVDKDNLKHNNMTPFFGSKTTQQSLDGKIGESMLDNMVGAGSTSYSKREVAPLFKPEDNVQFSNGAPNMTDFFRSRVNESNIQNNVKPFKSELVGPGLDQGYVSKGSGGFNSGMEERDKYMPKTVDELRIATNPKLEYSLEGHQGPAGHFIKKTGMMGKMEQHKQDTFYIQGEDRWLKTTGEMKAPSQRSKQEIHDTARMQSRSYTGGAGPAEKQANYIKGQYQPTHRQVLPTNPLTNAKGQEGGIHSQLIKESYSHITNNRDINNEMDSPFGNAFHGAIGAVISPLIDVLNPTKKQEVINNTRVYGNHARSEVEAAQYFDPNDVVPTTVKETTLYTPDMYMQNQKGDAYLVTQQQPSHTKRPETNQDSLNGVGGGANRYAQTDRTSSKRNRDDKEKTVAITRVEHGSTDMFNNTINQKSAKIDKDRNNNRMWNPTNMPSVPMSKEVYGKLTEPVGYQQNIAVERMAPDLLDAFKQNPYTHSLSSTR
tara:strand:+ start:6483 stop:8261 length:1779 start_codon:yes stop_codon:yes gene_type:complete